MISWFGGKNRMGKWVSSFIPKDIVNYVEPFSGAYWVYFKGDFWPEGNIVYNDMNIHMVNLFSCTKNSKVFTNRLNMVQSQNGKLFDTYQKEIFNPKNIEKMKIPNYDYAMKYAYIITQVFSGTNPENAKFMDLKGKYTSKYESFKNKLLNKKFMGRFKKINNFDNLDFADVIKKYDNINTLFYCDPPYYGFEQDGKKAYALNDFCRKDHERLSKVIKKIKGKFILSYYDFDELKIMFPENKYRWIKKNFKKAAGAKPGKKQAESTEVLILNY